MDGSGEVSVVALMDRMRAAGAGKSCGWKALDHRDVGFFPGELAIIAGRTGHGKTTVILNLLLHWLEHYPDERFILYSYEIPTESVFIKLVSALTRKIGVNGWTYNDIRRWVQTGTIGANTMGTLKELQEAMDYVTGQQHRIEVVYQPDWNVERLAQDARMRSVREGARRLGAILVDYLQIVPPPATQYENREHAVALTARVLKRLAVGIQAPIVSGAQISHEAARLMDRVPEGPFVSEKVRRAIAARRPQLHHLREGGGEQEADLVMGILNYRADYQQAHDVEKVDYGTLGEAEASLFEVLVLKNRNGSLGLAALSFDSRTGFIRDRGLFER
ncbi:MAG: DnaB helicase C-terminal domain-containing protein [Rhodospirillales bacterium]|nr:DnaB helicase C-terminal domain-containing protein [Rhodospirillales bacterium]